MHTQSSRSLLVCSLEGSGLAVEVHTYNSRVCGVEVGGIGVQDQPWIHSKLETNLGQEEKNNKSAVVLFRRKVILKEKKIEEALIFL